MKKFLVTVLAVVFSAALLASETDAVKNLTQEEGLKPTAVTLTAAQTAKIQAGMGTKQPVKTAYTFYVGKTETVVIEEQMGKWGPIKFAIAISKADRKVKGIEIFAMQEKRGVAVKLPVFLGQYTGKCTADAVEVGKDIKAVSGATVSSKAVCTAVKRALLVYGEAIPAGK
jgi:Na+-translocating ferredoxin:NAD+ oxidoreductase RnfG subunit